MSGRLREQEAERMGGPVSGRSRDWKTHSRRPEDWRLREWEVNSGRLRE